MPRAKQELKGLPGFYNQNTGGHGFLGRHFYNPTTGEALAVRQGQMVQRGQQTLSEALAKQQKQLSQRNVHYPHTRFKVTSYKYASGAYHYIETQAVGEVMIVCYGWLFKPYEGEEEQGYRSLTYMRPPRSFIKEYSLPEIWKRQEKEFQAGSALEFYVWERLKL